MKQRLSASTLLLLITAFLIYSATGVFIKLTSGESFLSKGYILYFTLVFLTMGIYAVLWQIILKRVPLSQAYLFKSMTIIFSLLFAFWIFCEDITWKNVGGAAFIIAGIVINSRSKTLA